MLTQKKNKKKRRDEDASLTCALKRLLVFSPLSLYLLLCLQMHRGLPKKKPHTRDATATPPHCRQWSNQMLLSCGALPAVRDGLKTAVSAFGRFFA